MAEPMSEHISEHMSNQVATHVRFDSMQERMPGVHKAHVRIDSQTNVSTHARKDARTRSRTFLSLHAK